MKVWIFQTGEPLHSDKHRARPMRAMNLANALVSAGHDVVLWSTDFYHQQKEHRFGKNSVQQISPNLTIKLLYSRGYSKNISPARLLDHIHLTYVLRKTLKETAERPDAVFVGYPPIEAAALLVSWSNKRNIPVILDVKDQWPEIFWHALPPKLAWFGRILFCPYELIAKQAMRNATVISSMSESFNDWVINFSGRLKKLPQRVYALTGPTEGVEASEIEAASKWWLSKGVDSESAVFMFVGSLSRAFDFAPIKYAAEKFLYDSKPVKFVICGDGEQADYLRAEFNDLSNVIFPGWIDRPKILSLANLSTASIAPYKDERNFRDNIPNKILDSLSMGLPIACPLKGEVGTLLLKHNVGFFYETGEALYTRLSEFLSNADSTRQISRNAENLYHAEFSYEKIYGRLVKDIEALVNK